MNTKEKWAFIINPAAGNGAASGMEGTLKNMIDKYSIAGEVTHTEKPGHAGDLAAGFYEAGFTHIIGVGGDGTFNEIASRLINKKQVITGLIPAGTGNDFIQITGFPDRLAERDWDSFFRAETVLMDAGKCNDKYFFNGMGLGFDAQVAAQNYVEPGTVRQGGKNKYIWHILKVLLFYREKKMIVTNADGSYETDCFMNTVSIGRRFAGGFLLTPKAIANDGLLDVCSIKKLSLFQRLRILLMVPEGKHIRDRRITYHQVSDLRLEFAEEVPFHVDGELNFSKSFNIELLPAALNIIYNPQGSHFFKP
jgi:diacylglycerol kinase (ATP)